MMNLRTLCLMFLEQDEDAQLWGGEPDDFDGAPDCDVIAKRFAAFVLKNTGRLADVVKVELDAPHDSIGGGPHWFAVVDGVAVDWTARQFYNTRGVNLDPSEIPSPLLFLWPGPYPLPTLTAEETQ